MLFSQLITTFTYDSLECQSLCFVCAGQTFQVANVVTSLCNTATVPAVFILR
jgi:hypothetical protein